MWKRPRLFYLLSLLSTLLVFLYFTFARYSTFQPAVPIRKPRPAGPRPQKHDKEGSDIEAEGHTFNFLSRPDIKAAKWKVQVHDKTRISPGYWFVAPIERIQLLQPGGSWIGPHIYDGNGDLIWSGAHLCENRWVADFRKLNVDGMEMLSWHNQHNSSAYIMDKHYRVTQKVVTAETGPANTHEFLTVDDGKHFLYTSQDYTNWSEERSLKELGYEGTCNVSNSLIIEKDVKSEEKLFMWSSEDHIPWSESTLEIEAVRKQCSHAWEYLHANAIDKFADGHYLLSSRLTDTIYKISKDDGSILWRLNGQGAVNGKSDFDMVNLNFSRQHDCRIHEQNDTYALISILDNSIGNDEQNATSNWSRALKIALHFGTQPMRAELVSGIDHPHRELSFRRGNYMILPNGNDFVGWSEQALHTEYTPEGELVLEAQLLSDKLGTYRSFKFPWIGEPDYPPDIRAARSLVNDEKSLIVSVSWNGATEVAEWVLYELEQSKQRPIELMRAPRSGFETTLIYHGIRDHVFVQAFDRNGKPLAHGRSTTLDTEKAPWV